MTASPQTPAGRPTERPTLAEWFQLNSRWVGIGAAVVAVAAAAFWFWTRSNEIKAANAERALLRAKQAMSTGNAALAATDLQQLVNRWDDTRAGGEAALLLAQLRYTEGKFADGVQVLRSVTGEAGVEGIEAAVAALIGDGLSEQGKWEEAAREYERAAGLAAGEGEKGYYLAKAARVWTRAGKKDDAVRIWQSLAESESEGLSAEAKVRLAELQAQPAGRS